MFSFPIIKAGGFAMAETIMCPYLKPSALGPPPPHEFEPKTKIKNGCIIYYCGKCKKVISVENEQISQILNALSDRFGINK
jgi:hypothetical protein